MLAGVSQGTLSVHLDCKGTTQYWKVRVPCPVSLCVTADAAVGLPVLDSEAMKTRLSAITINAFRTDPCQVIITFERSGRCHSFYFRPEEYGATISRCSLGRISRTLRWVNESGRAAAAVWVDAGDATVNCEWVIERWRCGQPT